jgi:hypothetical protein
MRSARLNWGRLRLVATGADVMLSGDAEQGA